VHNVHLAFSVQDIRGNPRAHTLRRRVARLCFRAFPVNLHELGVIDISAKSIGHSRKVGFMAVCGKLDAMG
jgi:hypothetical protein